MHSTSTYLLVIVVTLICTNLPSPVESKKTITSLLPAARHGSVNNLTQSATNGNINSSNVIHGRNNNVTARNQHNRVVNGITARTNEFPFVVAIFTKEIEPITGMYRQYFHCTGTLFRADWVLTAQHCLRDITDLSKPKIDPTTLYAFAGLNNLATAEIHRWDPNSRSRPTQLPAMATYLFSPFYAGNMYGDIALMQLVRGFFVGPSIALAPLYPRPSFVLRKSMHCKVVGWGDTYRAASKYLKGSSRPLSYANVIKIDTARCTELYRHMNETLTIDSGVHICVNESVQHHGPCNGDSGGPLICGGYQVGIISFAHLCVLSPFANVKIAGFTRWLDDTYTTHRYDPAPTQGRRSNETSSTSMRTGPGAYVVGVEIIVMVISFNVLC